jgi:hypothetical protein
MLMIILFAIKEKEKVRKGCGERKDGEGAWCGTDCNKGMAQTAIEESHRL